MIRSESKVRDLGNRFRPYAAIDNVPYRGRRSASMDKVPKGQSSEDGTSGHGVPPARWSISNRKNSSGHSEGKAPPVKDPRPLNDKAYQKRKVTQIIEVLENTFFHYPITVSKLMSPSKKDFEMIFQHLVHHFDPSYEVKRIEDEAPKILKGLSYPYIPNKSAFLHVSRTSFPAILGVLIFLMDNVNFLLGLDADLFFKSVNSERPEEHAVFLEYVSECYATWEDDEEAQQQVFSKLVNSRMPVNVDELGETHAEKKTTVEKLEKELVCIRSLEKDSDALKLEIQTYDEYFSKMENHYAKKEQAHQKLLEEKSEKIKELQVLQSKLAAKQTQYDAQGFDGKKQLQFYEEQLRELQAKLQQRRTELKEVQNECWEIEIQHAQTVDKGSAVCEEFQRVLESVSESSSAMNSALEGLKILQSRKFHSLQLDQLLPHLVMTQNMSQAAGNLNKALEEAKSQMDTTGVLFRGLFSAQQQKYQEVLMKNSELSIKLKVASAQENQKEQDLTTLNKKILDEVKLTEKSCEERIQLLEKYREKRIVQERNCADLKDELEQALTLKKRQESNLEKLEELQNEVFARYKRYVKEVYECTQEEGKKISTALEKLYEQISKNET